MTPRNLSVRRYVSDQMRRVRRLVFSAFRRPDLIGEEDRAAALELIYRVCLGRPMDEHGQQHYLRLMRERRMKLREVAAEIAASDEFQARLRKSVTSHSDEPSPRLPRAEALVDVHELSQRLSVEELARTADDYYRNTLEFADRYLAKPFDDPQEAPELLVSFAHLLRGLHLTPGMSVLDFGAGACWTSRFLTQLGCSVIALDVSGTALELGQQLFSRLPPIGNTPEPRFLRFDGRRIDLPDASVDRIACFDAFHHVPNPADVMRELGRVIRPGGIAGFSEPGPHHSTSARSQYEMKNYVAFENDVVMTDVWRWAEAAGFSGLELAVFSAKAHPVSLKEFEDVLAGGPALDAYSAEIRTYLAGHQTFFLTKGRAASKDSRERDGLMGLIAVRLERTEIHGGEPIRGHATVTNVGTAMWLAAAIPLGGVNLGVHLRSGDGRPLDVDFARIALETETSPGGTQIVDFSLSPPAPGEYLLEFDLVSEGVAWFEMNSSTTTTVRITVH